MSKNIASKLGSGSSPPIGGDSPTSLTVGAKKASGQKTLSGPQVDLTAKPDSGTKRPGSGGNGKPKS